jgi:Patatin-like phospholipase
MFRLLFLLDTQLIGLSFVCAMPAENMNTPRLFRTYSVEKYDSFDCAIWEAARATSAAPTFFKRIFIGTPPLDESFIDGGLGCNNPVKQILMEAEDIFPQQHIACIISIRTGHVTTTGLPSPRLLNKVIPLDVAKVLKKITTECEATAWETEWRFRSHCRHRKIFWLRKS